MQQLFLVSLIFLIAEFTSAACSSPSGTEGELKFISSKFQYCDGTNWVGTTNSTGAACNSGDAGRMEYVSGSFRYCDGTFWKGMQGSVLTSCAGVTEGTLIYDSGISKYKFCNGTDWYDLTGTEGGGESCTFTKSQLATSKNTGASNLTTASFTPSNNSLLMAVVGGLTESGSPTVTVSGGGLTWTKQVSSSNESNTYSGWFSYSEIWTAPVTTGSSMQVTLSDGKTANGRSVTVYGYTGYNTGSPVGSSATDIRDNQEGSWTITLSGAPATDSEVVAAVAVNNWDSISADNILVGTGWNELRLDSTLGTETQFQIQSRTASSSTSVLWDIVDALQNSGASAASVALEMKAAPGCTGGGSGGGGGCTGYRWTGSAGDGNWSNGNNWADGGAPTTSSVAIFDGSCCTGSNCNANINSAIDVGGVYINANYTGTITQNAGISVQLRGSGWTQFGGTFVGSNSPITSTGAFSISAGTFTSTSSTLTTTTGFTLAGTPTFNHNNGVIYVFSQNGVFNGNGKNFNDVILKVGNASYYTNITMEGSTATVLGNLSIESDNVNFARAITNGTINLKGHLFVTGSGASHSDDNNFIVKVNGTTNQNIDFSTANPDARIPSLEIASTGGNVNLLGTVHIRGHYTFTSGNLVAGTSTLKISLYNNNLTAVPGSVTYNNLIFEKYPFAYVTTLDLSGGTFKLAGNFSIEGCTSACTNPRFTNGTIEVDGNVAFNGGISPSSNISIHFTGANDATYNRNLAVDSNIPSGTFVLNKNTNAAKLTLLSELSANNINQDLTLTRGTLDMNGFNLTVNDILTISANGTLTCNGGVKTEGTLSNSGTLNCP